MEEGNQQPYFNLFKIRMDVAKLTDIYVPGDSDAYEERNHRFYWVIVNNLGIKILFYIKDDTISNGDTLIDFDIENIFIIESISTVVKVKT